MADAEVNFQQCSFLSELHVMLIIFGSFVCFLNIILYSDQVCH